MPLYLLNISKNVKKYKFLEVYGNKILFLVPLEVHKARHKINLLS